MPEDSNEKDKNKFFVTAEDIVKKLRSLISSYNGIAITSLTSSQKREYYNLWADFWRYVIGVNVIPAITREKIVSVPWKPYQTDPVSEEQHQQWKQEGAFDSGMAIIAGRVWHNPFKKVLYLILGDLDNQKAIDEFCTRYGVKTPLEELAKHMIIEQHRDDPSKAHFMVYATHPFPKKSSSAQSLAKLDQGEIPLIEVKGAGEHGLLYVTPSMHKNGFNYEIIGTTEPEVIDELEDHIQQILKKYNIQYPADGNDNTNTDHLTPIEELFKPDTKIVEGDNRHEALLRVMESLLRRNQNILEEYRIREIADDWNKDHCQPELNNREFERQWKDAKKFIEEQNKRRAYEQHQYQERVAREAYEQEWREGEQRKHEQKNPLSIHLLARLNEEGKMHYAAGQLTSLGMLYKRIRSVEIVCIKCGTHRTDVFKHPETSQYFIDRYERFVIAECQYFFGTLCNGRLKTTPEYVSAIDIEVSDPATLQDTDRLRYILFADDTKDVGIGENATILGTIYMETPIKNGPTFPVAYAQTLKYEDREQEELTRLDIEGIKRFRAKFPDDKELIKQLVKMTACNIIGLEDIKEGILYMVTNAKQDKRDKRERIHGIIVSDPGRAKTALLIYATKLMTRTTFETAQMSTGLSLLLIVEKSGDTKIIRLGPVPRSLFACIDEFNKLSYDDQTKFYGIMQEGAFSGAKYGIKSNVVAPTTILASINPPEGSKSATPDKDGRIDLTDINIVKPILDRFDFKMYIPPMKDDDEIRTLANARADLEGREVRDYSRFLKRYFIYAKQLIPIVKLTEHAKSILVEAYVEMAADTNKMISPRRQDVLFNLARARARICLRNVADGDDAKAIVDYFSRMIKDYESGTIAPKDPIEIGVDECYRILAESIVDEPIPYTVTKLLEQVCSSNPQVEKYIKSGSQKRNYFDRSNNKQARNIYERLMVKHPEIQIVDKRPTTLLLPRSKDKQTKVTIHSDHSDHSDPDQRDRPSENVSNLSVDAASLNPQILAPECGENQNQLAEASKSESERSERSDKIVNQDRKENKGCMGWSQPTEPNPNKYQCPECDYKDADPSKITTHRELHNGEPHKPEDPPE